MTVVPITPDSSGERAGHITEQTVNSIADELRQIRRRARRIADITGGRDLARHAPDLHDDATTVAALAELVYRRIFDEAM